jgi:branched-chain amino acid transport system permease protein
MVWVNAVVQGILLGGLYALFACGLSLMFGVMRVVNLAHGDLSVIAAFGGLLLVEQLGLPPFTTLLAVVPLLAALGYGLQRGLLTPALARGALPPLLVTFGLSIVLQNLLQETFSADTRSLQIGGFGTSSLRLTDDIAIGWFPLSPSPSASAPSWPCSSSSPGRRSAGRCERPATTATPPG